MRRIAPLLAMIVSLALLQIPPAAAGRAGGGEARRTLVTTVPVSVRFLPDTYGKVGVAQLVTVRFSQPVADKAAAERAITVTADKPLPRGSWGWVSDRAAVYRPKTFWPAHATISFDVRLRGVALWARGTTTYVGSALADDTFVLRTGRNLVLTIRNATHRLEVARDGLVIKTFPVSLGRPDYPTLRGIKVLSDDNFKRFWMSGQERNGGRSWNLSVPYALRLTASGEFIHGAPWATHRIGLWNGSHGCVNMFPRHAKWLYQRVRRGDPVITRGTERRMPTTDGRPGALWNHPWATWRELSAADHAGATVLSDARSAATAGP